MNIYFLKKNSVYTCLVKKFMTVRLAHIHILLKIRLKTRKIQHCLCIQYLTKNFVYFRKSLRLGSSIPWPDVMKIFTGNWIAYVILFFIVIFFIDLKSTTKVRIIIALLIAFSFHLHFLKLAAICFQGRRNMMPHQYKLISAHSQTTSNPSATLMDTL